MPTLSERALTLQESAIRKLDLVVAQHPGVDWLRLNIGQPDLPTPRPMLEAVKTFQPEVLAYGPASGLPHCRVAAASWLGSFIPGLSNREVIITHGASEALLFAMMAVGDSGDEVLVPEPFYTNYAGFATLAGMTVRGLPTRIEDDFALPSDGELTASLGPNTRALILSNPGNPTGAVYSASEIKRLVDWSRLHGVWLIIDEVYRAIWFETAPTSALAVSDDDAHVIVVDSLSKTWSACGLRLGMLVCRNEDLLERVERMGQARLGPQPLAQHVAIAAFGLDARWYEEVRLIWKHRVEALHRGLTGLPGVRTTKPAGAFYLMASLPVPNADAFARWLVTDFRHDGASVVLAPGVGFYATEGAGRQQVRVAAMLREEDLARAVDVLGAGLEAYDG